MTTIEVEFVSGPHSDDSGQKRLTPENLLNPDPASTLEVPGSMLGLPSLNSPPGPARQQEVLRPRLSRCVDRNVANIFEAGQAAMAFGYYYYPMYDVGCGQVFRAFDRAAVLRAQRGGCVQKRIMLANALDFLKKSGAFGATELAWFDRLRVLRNFASHPEFQARIPPGLAVWSLDDVARAIERLIGNASGQTPKETA